MTPGPAEGRLIIGVDIGGPKIAGGLVGDCGEIKSQLRTPMISDKGTAAGLGAVSSAIDAFFGHASERSQVRGIGICSPGPLGPEDGCGGESSEFALLAQFPAGRGNRENVRRAGEDR